ncbi:hypothetical protein, partial [Rhizobium johnstonii]|uniref:hypothetical protein n=1 Tax=Rhizobium johnstonii TaxID=3019933 RepID=UPI003F9A5F27
DRPKCTGLQRASLFTLPISLLGIVLLWLSFFTLIYDAYITSFGSSSYFYYVAQALWIDAVRYTWSIIHVRNTVGISLPAFS